MIKNFKLLNDRCKDLYEDIEKLHEQLRNLEGKNAQPTQHSSYRKSNTKPRMDSKFLEPFTFKQEYQLRNLVLLSKYLIPLSFPSYLKQFIYTKAKDSSSQFQIFLFEYLSQFAHNPNRPTGILFTWD